VLLASFPILIFCRDVGYTSPDFRPDCPSTETSEALREMQISEPQIRADVERALREDGAWQDLTAALVSQCSVSSAKVVCRQPAVLCGSRWFEAVFRTLNARARVLWHSVDGDRIGSRDVVCELCGPSRALLSGERTALNFLQTLSGTATVARTYSDAVRGLKTRILDTRKTVPGLRLAQKYAVACGGCQNHRMGLHDGILIKENHILAAGSITAAVAAAQALDTSLPVEVEVETLKELEVALAAGADRLLLDNFSHADLERAVILNAGRAMLEASGGISLENVAAVAATGVDFISVGALTKDVHAVDLSMRFVSDREV
jgi:nicotinate-nucleotide pyrophosphorylase (carboxylating)